MNDNETPREAIAGAIQGSWPNIIEAWESGTGDLYTLDNLDEHDARDMATAVIAHLWERADDWETVQRPIAAMLEGEVKCDVHPESYHHKLEDMAAQITATIMTALIGPRPAEQEAER